MDTKNLHTMEQMARSPFLLASLFSCDLCCFASIPILSYWIRKIWNMKLMHFNTRLLLCFHLFWLLVHVIGRSVLHTTDIITYLTPFQNGCQILHTRAGCFFLRLPFNVALVISNCSAIFVSIERLIATLKTKTYEHGYKNIGYTLMLLQVDLSKIIISHHASYIILFYIAFCDITALKLFPLLAVFLKTTVTTRSAFLKREGNKG
ncbi:unnamed protein product [Haemonchus placei]|uniref:G_PROTEIN_RECEP_F1_2 domain-containing protein n=1 Tax=Haemonchus placei TaxID=6290 RepID=A0A3P7UNL4_HAEPC|nr:unnamed protein product [Haemonchus placei]